MQSHNTTHARSNLVILKCFDKHFCIGFWASATGLIYWSPQAGNTESVMSQHPVDDVILSRHCDALQIWRPVTSVDRHRCIHATSCLSACTQNSQYNRFSLYYSKFPGLLSRIHWQGDRNIIITNVSRHLPTNSVYPIWNLWNKCVTRLCCSHHFTYRPTCQSTNQWIDQYSFGMTKRRPRSLKSRW